MYRNYSRWAIAIPENESNYLIHHGTKGQKWGVRKYQNADGSLTSEGRRHYGIGERLRRAGQGIRNFMTEQDENGQRHLSKRGKAALIGAGAATAIGAGAIIGAKTGAFKSLKNSLKAVQGMDNERLETFSGKAKENLLTNLTGRNTAGQLTGNKFSLDKTAKAVAIHAATVKEAGERQARNILSNILDTPVRTSKLLAQPTTAAEVDTVVKDSLKNVITKTLAVGTAATAGATALALKEKYDKEDPTGQKGRYMAPNPNKKK